MDFSQGLSLSTVVYNYVRFRHTSSTVIPQSLNSRCSYFGCYEAYYGFIYYTFSEVSCTAPGACKLINNPSNFAMTPNILSLLLLHIPFGLLYIVVAMTSLT